MNPADLANGVLLVGAILAAVAGTHALLHQREPSGAWGWIAVCWMFPVVGPVLYWLLGINRIHNRARKLSFRTTFTGDHQHALLTNLGSEALPAELRELSALGRALTGRPLCAGNRVTPLVDGDTAYPAMLQAIRSASKSLSFSTYIYRADQAGSEFAAAFQDAQKRGVKVRVLLDGMADACYRPSVSKILRSKGLNVGLFLPPRWLPPLLHINLRNHRKLLIVDDRIAFTGGMNVSDGHCLKAGRHEHIEDVHFQVEGPVVNQVARVFADDWRFATGEDVVCEEQSGRSGSTVARVITDGPNEDRDRLVTLLQGALANAHRRVWVMTPYFLPTAPLVGALQSAAMRGIDVCLIIPEKSDQPWIDWATRHLLPRLHDRGIDVRLCPGDFAHTKLLVVDDYYVQFGSANMDPRSLSLNFELNVECYDRELAAWCAWHMGHARAKAVRLGDSAWLLGSSFWIRLRNAACWLMSPYL